VAGRFVACRDQVETRVLQARELSLHDSRLRRVALVVGGIDRQHGRSDAREARPRVVVARSVPLIEEVVGVGGERRREPFVHKTVGRLARGRRLLKREGSAVRGDAEEDVGSRDPFWLHVVIAAVPARIPADRVDQHAPHHPVAAGHRGGVRRHRDQPVHEIGVGVAPNPSLHPAHRIADHQTQMANAQPLGQQPVLRLDHVVVVVSGESGA
jgi:hypothetical protein